MPDPAMPDQTPSTPPVDPTQAVNAASGVPTFAQIQSQFGGIPLTPDEIKQVKGDYFDTQKKLTELSDRAEKELEASSQPPPPPERQPGLLDRLAPLLFLTAFTGGAGKAAAGNAFAATVGATRGFLAGDQANYEQQQQSYGQYLAALKTHQEEVDKIYQTMREAYKDRIDGDLKALQFARQVTGDESKLTAQAVDHHDQSMRFVEKLDQQWKEHQDIERDKKEKAAQAAGAAAGLPEGWTQEKIDYYAAKQLAGDTTWRTGLGRTKEGVAIIKAVDKRVPEMSKERGSTPEKDITTVQSRQALGKTLNQRQQYVAASSQFVSNFQKQADLVEQYAKAGTANGGASVINAWIQAGRKATSDPAVRKFDLAINGLVREHMRIVTGVTSNAQLHQGAAEIGDRLLNDSFTPEDISAALQEMRAEAQNALQSGKDEVATLTQQLEQLGAAPTAPAAGAPPGAAPASVDDILKKYPQRTAPGG